MRDIATFVGNSGESVAIIYEFKGSPVSEGYWKVNYGNPSSKQLMSKIFMTENEATNFAAEWTNQKSNPTLLNE